MTAFPRSHTLRCTDKGTIIEWPTVERPVRVEACVSRVDDDGSRGPLEGVVVSDGESVRVTDADGRARFDVAIDGTGLRFVHVSCPSGWRCITPWFRMIPPDEACAEYAFEFVLAPAGEGAGGFRFVVTGDSQGAGAAWKENLREDFAQLSEVWGDPAFHVIAGDLTKTGWKEEWDAYAEARSAMTLRHYELFGGHGGNYAGERAVGEDTLLGSVDHYHLYCGPSWHSWNVGGVHFVALNSVSHDYQTRAADRRMREWIARDLEHVGPETPIVAFSHAYLTPLPEAFRGRRLIGNFYGHWHSNGVCRHDGAWFVRTAPLRGRDWGAFSRTFRVVDVKDGRLSDELRVLGQYQRLEIVSPQARAGGGAVPVVVLAYDSAAAVRSVSCTIEAQGAQSDVPLEPHSAWTWRGDWDASNAAPGTYRVRVVATDVKGRTWRKESAFELSLSRVARPHPGRDWPAFLRDATHPRTTPDSPAPPFQLAWVAQTGGRNAMFSSPVVYGGRIFLGVQDNRIDWPSGGVLCFEAATGRPIWRAKLPSIDQTVAARDGRVFALSCQGAVHGLRCDDGQEVWRCDLRTGHHAARTPLVFIDDLIVIDGWAEDAVLVEPDTGRIVRSLTDDDAKALARLRPPLYKTKRLYHAGIRSARDARTGEDLWQRICDADRRGPTTPAIARGRAYLTTGLTVVALDIERRETLWTHESAPSEELLAGSRRQKPFTCHSSPAVAGDLVIAGNDTGEFFALDRTSGRLCWRFDMGLPIKSSPVVSGNMILIADYDGNLYCFVGE